MKRPLNWIFIVSILFLTSQPLLAKDNKGTWTGEIVDMGCYIEKGLKGPGHAKCAEKCILQYDMPMGLLTKDGTLYLLTPNHEDRAPYNGLKQQAAKNETVFGTLSEKDDIKMIVVDDFKAAEGAVSKEKLPESKHQNRGGGAEHPK